MARPSKYDPETVKVIIDAILDCMTYAGAADAGGISYETFNEWRKNHPEFSEAVLKANAEAKRLHLKRVNQAGKRDWRASAWMLERRWPEDYALKSALDLTSKGEKITWGQFVAITEAPDAKNAKSK